MLDTAKQFVLRFFEKSKQDELTMTAGHLAFVTLLSFVPFVTVILSTLSTFSFFDEAQRMLESFIFDQFVPNAGTEIREHLQHFMQNIGKMTGLSALALVVIALSLLKNIDKELNRIFVTKKVKPLWQDILIYLIVILLGPALIGLSLIATSALLAMSWLQEVASWFPDKSFNALIPMLFSFFYFLLLYRIVPAKPPSSQVAVIGAVITALLFEACKYLFSWYIRAFPTYQVIYGSLAAIPIFFLWVYFNWMVVLLGAELTCVLDEFKNPNKKDDKNAVSTDKNQL
ncbi:YihY family inner membrane protein [Gayadomonas joobiniege]|uniref:YihY family inner membrane protein n=1 Tax=Gayadomonas joobiniege TaxID=1234606 RepID=UPI00035DA93A|nr:YihY family inner membrane protein [Gayadomonas joobiniege]